MACLFNKLCNILNKQSFKIIISLRPEAYCNKKLIHLALVKNKALTSGSRGRLKNYIIPQKPKNNKISVQFFYPYVAGTNSRPGYIVFGINQICLSKYNNIGIRKRPTGKSEPTKKRSKQTLSTLINQLKPEEFEGTSSCNVGKWL